MTDPRPDDELLAATPHDPAAFGAFYERHEDLVLLFLLRRCRDAEVAADLAAETFARALESSRRFRPEGPPATAWLLGIARNVWLMSLRAGRVENQARRRLGMEPLVLDDRALQAIVEVDDERAIARLASLPDDQREAIFARVIGEDGYAEIAERLRCSESVVRKRVSRGLARLRLDLEEGS